MQFISRVLYIELQEFFYQPLIYHYEMVMAVACHVKKYLSLQVLLQSQIEKDSARLKELDEKLKNEMQLNDKLTNEIKVCSGCKYYVNGC